MAEIKSTLDLVMERTRNLTMTDEEKQEQALADFRTAVSGLIWKYADEILSPDQFRDELNHLEQTSEVRDMGVVLDEIAKRLHPDQDNQRLLRLVDEVCGVDATPIESALDNYAQTIASRSLERIEDLKRILLDSFGISGSAVLPNLDADSDWTVERQSIRESFTAELQREIDALKSASAS